eukprot:3009838-Rhodomonas_salina.2
MSLADKIVNRRALRQHQAIKENSTTGEQQTSHGKLTRRYFDTNLAIRVGVRHLQHPLDCTNLLRRCVTPDHLVQDEGVIDVVWATVERRVSPADVMVPDEVGIRMRWRSALERAEVLKMVQVELQGAVTHLCEMRNSAVCQCKLHSGETLTPKTTTVSKRYGNIDKHQWRSTTTH